LPPADLLACPIARNVAEPDRANPPFDVFANKIYSVKGNVKGVKTYSLKERGMDEPHRATDIGRFAPIAHMRLIWLRANKYLFQQ